MNNARPCTEAQREVAVHVLQRIWDIATAVGPTYVGLSHAEVQDRRRERGARWRQDQVPHDQSGNYNVFTLNGGRGSGKTTLLRKLREVLPFLGVEPSDLQAGYPQAVGELRTPPASQSKTAEPGAKPPPILPPKLFQRLSDDSSRPTQRAALALPIIDPSQFEGDGRTVMEQILAHLRNILEENRGPVGRDAERDSLGTRWREQAGPEPHGKAREFSDLADKVAGKVARGWVYAQSFGQDMIATDSASFDEYVAARSKESVFAALRHRNWRTLVDQILDVFDARLLVICIDDCDLTPANTLDVVDAIRIYLNSPRIVVLMATDEAMLKHNMRIAHLRNFVGLEGIFASSYRAAFEQQFVEMIDRELDEAALFLDKIVPQPNRYYLDDLSPTRAQEIYENQLAALISREDKWLVKHFLPDLMSSFSLRDLDYLEKAIVSENSAEQPKALANGNSVEQSKPSRSLYSYLRFTTSLASDIASLDAIEDFADSITISLDRAGADICNLRIRLDRPAGDEPIKPVTDISSQFPSRRFITTEIVGQFPSRRIARMSRTLKPRHQWDQLRIGQMVAFLIDRRRCEPGPHNVETNISNTTASGITLTRRLPPTLLEDVRSLPRTPFALEKELATEPPRLPRNCRFLAESLRLLSSGRLRRGVIEPTRIENIAKLRPSALGMNWSGRPFLDLMTDPNFVGPDLEVTERIMVALAAIDMRKISMLDALMEQIEQDFVKAEVQTWYDHKDDLRGFPLYEVAKRLLNGLVATSTAAAYLGDSIFLYRARGQRGSTGQQKDGLPAFEFSHARYEKAAKASAGTALARITEELGEIAKGTPAGAADLTAEQAEGLLDLLIACVGPISSLRQHINEAAVQLVKPLSAICQRLRKVERFPTLGGIETSAADKDEITELLRAIERSLQLVRGRGKADDYLSRHGLTEKDVAALAAFLDVPHSIMSSTLAQL